MNEYLQTKTPRNMTPSKETISKNTKEYKELREQNQRVDAGTCRDPTNYNAERQSSIKVLDLYKNCFQGIYQSYQQLGIKLIEDAAQVKSCWNMHSSAVDKDIWCKLMNVVHPNEQPQLRGWRPHQNSTANVSDQFGHKASLVPFTYGSQQQQDNARKENENEVNTDWQGFGNWQSIMDKKSDAKAVCKMLLEWAYDNLLCNPVKIRQINDFGFIGCLCGTLDGVGSNERIKPMAKFVENCCKNGNTGELRVVVRELSKQVQVKFEEDTFGEYTCNYVALVIQLYELNSKDQAEIIQLCMFW